MHTFAVSAVDPVTTRLETVSADEAVHILTSCPRTEFEGGVIRVLRAPVRQSEGTSAHPGGLVAAQYHPLVAAVGQAFHEHRPLRLTPDHIWLAIAQGLALHVQENTEALRTRFVQHAGREQILVQRDDFAPGIANPWHEMIDAFRAEVRERIGKKHDLFVADFSTTTATARTASAVVLLGAMQGYFQYDFVSLCGIPSITLDGTPDDWAAIRQRVDVLHEFDLSDWVATIAPLLDRFVDASLGHVDQTFWRNIYKLNESSGGPYITGWLQCFFPYVGKMDRPRRRSPFHTSWREGMDAVFGGGPTTEDLPPGLSSVPFRWRYRTESIDMEMLGGFVGITQDADGAISPALGWAIRTVES